MRNFNYIKDWNIISTTIKGYITQMDKEINLLQEQENNQLYVKAAQLINEFKSKYSNLSSLESLICNDLTSKSNVEYYFKYKKYPFDASSIGLEFEKDLKRIIFLEDELRELAILSWQTKLTSFSDIINGEDFMIVGHASYNLPGTKDCLNYKRGEYTRQFLSCSLLSNNELNTFNSIKIVFLSDVNSNNYISSSSFDSVTNESNKSSFQTLKEIYDGKNMHYIDVGYMNDIEKSVTTISIPDLIERLSIQRELKENGEMFNYEKSCTNEIVLDRTTTKIKGTLLLSNGCDLLLDEYLLLKKNNIEFKCLNKGLYRQKNGLMPYTKKELDEFIYSLHSLGNYMENNKLSPLILLDYYNEVVLPMKYSDEINYIIKEQISKYVDIPLCVNNKLK